MVQLEGKFVNGIPERFDLLYESGHGFVAAQLNVGTVRPVTRYLLMLTIKIYGFNLPLPALMASRQLFIGNAHGLCFRRPIPKIKGN